MNSSFTIKGLSDYLEAELYDDSNGDASISQLANLDGVGKNIIACISDGKDFTKLLASQAKAIVLSTELVELFFKKYKQSIFEVKSNVSYLIHSNPYWAFARLTKLFSKQYDFEAYIHPSACIHKTAKIGKDVCINAGVVISANVNIGDRCYLGANTTVKDETIIGDHSWLDNGVFIYHQITIGKYCIIHSGSAIGCDGFGYAIDVEMNPEKIFHLGNVIIGDHVEIGSNVSIDRGTLESTRIGDHVKIDNLVHIAHNCVIKNNSFIAAQCGISGSTVVGSYCRLGGQVGVAGHLEIVNGVSLTAKSGVNQPITQPGKYGSTMPLMPYMKWQRNRVTFKQLYEMGTEVKLLKKSVLNIK